MPVHLLQAVLSALCLTYLMYIVYNVAMIYTVAEFKKNTRKILNEALVSPVTIKRYTDEFTITNAQKVTGEPSITYKGEVFVGQRNVSAIERLLEVEPTAYIPGTKPKIMPHEPVKELVHKRSQKTWCKEHDMEKEFCKGFKHGRLK